MTEGEEVLLSSSLAHAIYNTIRLKKSVQREELLELCDLEDANARKRAVYQTLEILYGSGLIDIFGNTICEKLQSADIAMLKAIKSKQETLKRKLKILSLYKCIAARNMTQAKPDTVVYLPAIIFGSSDPVALDFNGTKQVEFAFNSPPVLYSPVDVLERIDFPLAMQQNMILEIAEIRDLASLITGGSTVVSDRVPPYSPPPKMVT